MMGTESHILCDGEIYREVLIENNIIQNEMLEI